MFPSKRTIAIAFLSICFAAIPSVAQANDPSATLNSLESTARNSTSDISRMRIEKWKADGNTKKGAQTDSESLQRNMSSALPELIGKVRSAPNDLNANFKLYRNLDVLYDVFSRFAETAGAFGNRDDFEALARDLDGLDSARRSLADRLDLLTTSTQAELTQLRNQARAAQATATTAPPRKIVIDDSEPEKKSATKKKKPASNTTPASGSGSNNSSGNATPK